MSSLSLACAAPGRFSAFLDWRLAGTFVFAYRQVFSSQKPCFQSPRLSENQPLRSSSSVPRRLRTGPPNHALLEECLDKAKPMFQTSALNHTRFFVAEIGSNAKSLAVRSFTRSQPLRTTVPNHLCRDGALWLAQIFVSSCLNRGTRKCTRNSLVDVLARRPSGICTQNSLSLSSLYLHVFATIRVPVECHEAFTITVTTANHQLVITTNTYCK